MKPSMNESPDQRLDRMETALAALAEDVAAIKKDRDGLDQRVIESIQRRIVGGSISDFVRPA